MGGSQLLVGPLLLLLLGHGLWLAGSQEVFSFSNTEEDCINGQVVFSNNETTICECYPGWSGYLCSFCRGRIRLTESTGIIADDALDMHYTDNTQCLFYIEADQSVSSIHLKVHLLHLECQWDYLHVFDGDSFFAPKLASYTGDILEQPPIIINNTSEEEMDFVLNPQHTLDSSGPEVLLYFYSDAALGGPGFELSYWLERECPDFCSEAGVCDNTTGLCSCDPGFTGDACHIPVCPSNCSGNGVCDLGMKRCVCNQGFQGDDCSVDVAAAHWSTVSYSSSPPPSTLARAAHSAVMWEGDMLVYGGYRFPKEGGYFEERQTVEESGRSIGVDPVENDVILYQFESGVWEVLDTTAAVTLRDEDVGSGEGNGSFVETRVLPAPRYGHSAVLYDGCMYVFGGSLFPSETITEEFWRLNLTSLEWTPLFNVSMPPSTNATEQEFDNSTESLVEPLHPPVPVRGHTAHVVGSKMIVLLGLSRGEDVFPVYVQEYDFTSGEWSLAVQRGEALRNGRMGHSSVYSEKEGLIYVHGGRNSQYQSDLLSYDPQCHAWAIVTSSPSIRYLHSTVLLGPLLVSFGGCQGHNSDRDCFSHDLVVYNILCNDWETVQLPGLPPNASRYGHTSMVPEGGVGGVVVFGGFVGTLRSDMLLLSLGNCSRWLTEEDCVNGTFFCAWRTGEDRCVPVSEVQTGDMDVLFQCDTDPCMNLDNQTACDLLDACEWNTTSSLCVQTIRAPLCPAPSTPPTVNCSELSSCESCQLYNCHWGRKTSEIQPGCFSESDLDDQLLNITEIEECSSSSCFSRDSCSSCTSGNSPCLWCPSLQQCIPGQFNVVYNYGQCLGWRNGNCEEARCEQRTNCSSCQELSECGWCNDPSNTGLGQCRLGGFRGPRNQSICQVETDSSVSQEEWHFIQCPACQCNGHSTCVNDSSVCEDCMDNTEGATCEICSLGYFGDPRNGQSCDECDCNGYDTKCNVVTGRCVCQSLGVGGNHCTNCSGDYRTGDADNFCHANLEVGFIYTFAVTAPNEVQGFYSITPRRDESLNFRFQLSRNPNGFPVVIQLFVGRLSENLWLLVNITDAITLPPLDTYTTSFDDFSSNTNLSDAMLTSFAHPEIRNTENFTALLEGAVENDYTRNMWDGDVTLVLHVSSLTAPTEFRITVDQENYIYLLYFFATFISCFSVLLTGLLVGWFIKKKLAMRAYMRRQYIELQRRVARPFTRILLEVKNKPQSSTDSPLPTPAQQNPSYVGVEACRDDKAAILSLLVQLPRDPKTGHPSHGRTGLCLGSTLVYINSSKKPKAKKKGKGQKEEPEGGGRRGGGDRGRRVGPQNGTSGENSHIVHTGRARHRNLQSESSQSSTVEVA